jgi:hypothetical protein
LAQDASGLTTDRVILNSYKELVSSFARGCVGLSGCRAGRRRTDHAPLPSRRTRTRTGFHLAKSDASQASAGHPRPCATSCFPLRADVAACPGCSPDLSSCAGVCPCSARPGSCCANVPSTGCARRVAVHPYYDFAPTRAALLPNPQTTSVDHLGWLQFRHLFRYYPGHAGRAG